MALHSSSGNHQILPILLKAWRVKSNEFIDKIYNNETNGKKWVKEITYPEWQAKHNDQNIAGTQVCNKNVCHIPFVHESSNCYQQQSITYKKTVDAVDLQKISRSERIPPAGSYWLLL